MAWGCSETRKLEVKPRGIGEIMPLQLNSYDSDAQEAGHFLNPFIMVFGTVGFMTGAIKLV
jgi:hypothetical protein